VAAKLSVVIPNKPSLRSEESEASRAMWRIFLRHTNREFGSHPSRSKRAPSIRFFFAIAAFLVVKMTHAQSRQPP
jgi:hypothetical protein